MAGSGAADRGIRQGVGYQRTKDEGYDVEATYPIFTFGIGTKRSRLPSAGSLLLVCGTSYCGVWTSTMKLVPWKVNSPPVIVRSVIFSA